MAHLILAFVGLIFAATLAFGQSLGGKALLTTETAVSTAVAFVVDGSNTSQPTGTSFTMSVTVSGTHPALVAYIGANMALVDNDITSVSSNVSGNFTEIAHFRDVQNSLNAFGSIWCLAAPAAGAHTITTTSPNSYIWIGDVAVFKNTDQSTPCPSGDATGDNSTNSLTITMTPSNLTSNDNSFGGCTSTAGSPTGITQNQTVFLNSSTPQVAIGYSIGTASIVVTGVGAFNTNHGCATARVKAG
jgi:hypothetical protein